MTWESGGYWVIGLFSTVGLGGIGFEPLERDFGDSDEGAEAVA